jgi:hypothetical protein
VVDSFYHILSTRAMLLTYLNAYKAKSVAGQARNQVDGGGGLACTTFLIGYGNDV